VIAARADYRLLVRKHVEIEWPDRASSNIAWAKTILSRHSLPRGFDASSSSSTAADARKRAAGLLAKPEFAPIVLLILQDAPNPEPPPSPAAPALRAQDRPRRLIRAIMTASREHKQALSLLRSHPDFEQRYRSDP